MKKLSGLTAHWCLRDGSINLKKANEKLAETEGKKKKASVS